MSQRSRSMVEGQGHKVVGQGQMSQKSRSMVVGQGHKVKVKVIWGVFSPHRLAGGSTRGRFHIIYILFSCPVTLFFLHFPSDFDGVFARG